MVPALSGTLGADLSSIARLTDTRTSCSQNLLRPLSPPAAAPASLANKLHTCPGCFPHHQPSEHQRAYLSPPPRTSLSTREKLYTLPRNLANLGWVWGLVQVTSNQPLAPASLTAASQSLKRWNPGLPLPLFWGRVLHPSVASFTSFYCCPVGCIPPVSSHPSLANTGSLPLVSRVASESIWTKGEKILITPPSPPLFVRRLFARQSLSTFSLRAYCQTKLGCCTTQPPPAPAPAPTNLPLFQVIAVAL
ncbi:hypothetical protein B0T24DRAFT_65959 [Lasiosphaeria ovina]|uniref:Uncharacterized protein n=1 Tax=Lasiosphaeria ovina TaxID=92902 RepID=A0AAE0NLR7_9PEZI|nr:hypothetical protein B0T24DRAFT_65959 [Lasiosphaeria ovina]